MATIPENKKIEFQDSIIDWYRKNIITYPWHKNKTPYSVLISEILLIRTKASQVILVFNDFMKKYPTLESFLNFKPDTIEEIIKPIGLLFRAKLLEDIAKQVKTQFNSQIPNNLSDLKSLKGIGNYTGNAILCFGFNEKRPLLDVNFIRIYKRVFNINSKTKNPKNDKFLWEFSEYLLPDSDYVDYNYAILNFGIEICLNKKPKCNICPIKKICLSL